MPVLFLSGSLAGKYDPQKKGKIKSEAAACLCPINNKAQHMIK
jgi:hypothetical protein